jgi:hypothetical protein
VRRATDDELFHDSPDDSGSIELGTVGWQDGADHYDAEAGGLTLVKVTLFRGAAPPAEGETPDPERARGRQILARLSAPLWYVPADGAVVHVSIPAGFGAVPGGPMIIGVAANTPAQQFATNGGNDAILDFGPDRRVIIKAGGGVILSDYENRYVGVSPEIGFKIGDADASGACLKGGKWLFYGSIAADAKVVLELDANGGGIRLADKGGAAPAGLEIKGGNWIAYGTKFAASTAAVYLGSSPTNATPVLYGSPGSPLASLGVFVSPT